MNTSHEFNHGPKGSLSRRRQVCSVCGEPPDAITHLEYEEAERIARVNAIDEEKERRYAEFKEFMTRFREEECSAEQNFFDA